MRQQLGQVAVEALAFRAAKAAGRTVPPIFAFDKAVTGWTCTLKVPVEDFQKHRKPDLCISFLKVSAFTSQGFKGRPVSLTQSHTSLILQSKNFMNLSGLTAKQFLKRSEQRQALDAKLFFVAHDDLEIPSATYALRFGGSNKGHNGLRSIEQELGTNKYHHIKVGIGRPEDQAQSFGIKQSSTMSIADWCLSPATRSEMQMAHDVDGVFIEETWKYLVQQYLNTLQ